MPYKPLKVKGIYAELTDVGGYITRQRSMLNSSLPKKDMMSVEDFLEAYSISRSNLYSEIRKGKIKARKVGARTYILRSDAEAWMNALEVKEV